MNSNPPPQVNAKCDVAMKLSVFVTRTDTHTHTHKAKPIHPHVAGCNNRLKHEVYKAVQVSAAEAARPSIVCRVIYLSAFWRQIISFHSKRDSWEELRLISM